MGLGSVNVPGGSSGGSAAEVLYDNTASQLEATDVQDAIDELNEGKAASDHKHSASDINSGTLGTGRGGTGMTSNPSMLTNLGSTTAANVFQSSPRPGVTGTLPLGNGGTGQTTAPKSLHALINGSTSITKDALVSEDIIGIGDVSASTGKKMTVGQLLGYIEDNADIGGGLLPQIVVTGPTTGSTVTATKSGSSDVTLTESNGTWTGNLPDYGTWTITATLGSSTASDTVTVTEVKQYSLTLAYFNATINVTAPSGSTVTVAKNGTTVATHTGTGSAVAVNVHETGTYTITATSGSETATDTASITSDGQTVSVALSFIPANLADATPAQIQSVAQAGTGDDYWDVGDKIGIKVNGTFGGLTYNDTVYAFILSFSHNTSDEGTGIHFQFGKTASGIDIAWVQSYGSTGTGFCMNTTNTNSGGWSGSYMRNTICAAFLNALPSAWQNVIASTTKYTDNTGNNGDTASKVTTTSDKIFLLSEFEVQGTRSYANSAEQNHQKQYDYYKNGNSKIKYQHTNTGSACNWWLRSVNARNATNFCIVNADGSANIYGAYISYGFAPGFKVA